MTTTRLTMAQALAARLDSLIRKAPVPAENAGYLGDRQASIDGADASSRGEPICPKATIQRLVPEARPQASKGC